MVYLIIRFAGCAAGVLFAGDRARKQSNSAEKPTGKAQGPD
jgi:hypothetical protein